MAIDQWNGTGDWNTDKTDWSTDAPPLSTSYAEIETGTATISTSGVADLITVDSAAALDVTGDSTLSIGDWFRNFGQTSIDTGFDDGGATKVSILGALINTGTFDIGNTGLAAATKVTAASLANYGTLGLQGNASASPGSTGLATLDITGAADTVSRGDQRISGDADLEFGSGAVTAVGVGATLELDGALAKVTTGGTTTSALSTLSVNRGTLTLQGGTGLGAGGAILTTTVALNNLGTVLVDTGYQDGGSTLSLGAGLTNTDTLDIGNTGLSANASVTATAFKNIGTLVVQGNSAAGAADKASLVIAGAAAATSTGSIRVSGDATIGYGSGEITAVGHGASLELDGSQASITTTGGASALGELATNSGTLTLQGNTGDGAGGASMATAAAFTNIALADLYIDTGYTTGESTVNFGGGLTNDATLDIGNTGLDADTTVDTTLLTNDGTLVLQGNAANAATDKATLDASGAAGAVAYASLRVSGDAQLEFGSGEITTVAYGGTLELDGSQASITTAGGASALATLAANHGTVVLAGNSGNGANGATLTTTTAYSNFNLTYVDNGYQEGGSTANFGGVLANYGAFYIGNTGLGANTKVDATGLGNDGTLILQGNTSNAATDKALLSISGAAAAASSAALRVSGDAQLAFTSGEITSIGAGASLELDGSQAEITTVGGASALAKLAANNGMLVLQGDTGEGANGATITTTATAFTNNNTVDVDTGYQDAASTATFGGALTNNGTFNIGNTGIGANTAINATTLVNNGTLNVQGNTASGSLFQTALNLSGAAAAISTGYTRVGGAATIQFGSGGITSIATGSWLELDGSGAQILTDGGSSSALAGLAVNDGDFVLRGNNGLGLGGVSLTTTTSFINEGTTLVDAYANGDGGSNINFGGTLNNTGVFDIGNSGQSGGTTVTAKALVNYGTLDMVTGSAVFSKLVVDGVANNDGTLTINADTELDVTGTNAFTQLDGTTTIDGTLIAKTVNANDGFLIFNSAVTSGDGLGALDIGALGTLEFFAGVDSSHTVDFTGTTGTLDLGAPSTFDATIAGFAGNDAIDLLNSAATKVAYSGTTTSGTLTVSGSSGTLATLAFTGDYKTSSFSLASDGRSGTLLIL